MVVTVTTTDFLYVYTAVNNSGQILLFGHPNPWSSFTTIQINGTNYIFKADSTVYDMENRKATSTMTVSGVKVVQTLQIVKNDSTGLEDTVHISYATINLTSTSKRVGVRIMMDTMLGNNDGAPFRIPSRGEVTKELELVGSQVPAYWQAFDNLSDPSVFAIGTIYKGNQSRKPDKVQFASWGGIYATTWDYTINTDRKVTNDSAVAFYWNPITLASGSTNTVETYYGVGLSSNGGIDDVPIEFDTKDKYVVFVTKNSGKELLAGATVQIEGVGTAVTNENGIATFSSNLPISSYASRKQMTISCNGYRTKDVFRMVSKDRSSAVGMVADNGKPYVKSISLIGTDGGSFSEYVDLMSENYSVEADSKAAETSYYEIRITATSNGKGNVGRYKIIQDNVVILQEDITRDTRTVRLMKSKLKAGKRVYVQIETTDGSLSDKIATTLLVNPQKTILGEDSKDTEGSIKLGGSGVGFKIPNDAVAFGGMELNMDMPGLPIEFEAFDDGTVKVSVGLDEFGNTWEEKEEKWDELFAKYERGSNLQSVFTNDQGTTSWKVAGGFDVSFVGKGYAEGKIDDYGNCNVDLMLILGVKGEYEYTQQYIVGYIPLGFEFKVGVKGTYTVGGTLTVGKNLANERVFDFTGNKGKIDIDIYASLYGGLGLVGVLTVGGEGEAHLLLGYDFQQQYYDAKVKGSIALSAKAFMFSAKYVIAERTWNITSGYITKSSADQQSIYEVFYDRSSYSMMSREYLSANPNRSDVAAEMESFFQNVYPGASQKIVMVDGTPYMFWLADDINRTEANRTSLVYSKYDGEWSEPVAVKDDGTADFNFDVVSDGSKIHIVWQDMAVEFGGSSWNNMSDADRLTEMARNSDISYACIDTSADMAVSTKVTSQNGYADMLPKITVNSGLPYVVWYTNESNDILTQSGNTTLNMAAITYDSVSVANYSSEDEEEIDQEEIDTEEEDMEEEDGEAEEDTGDTDTEDTDTREEDFESADTEEESSGDTDTEDTDGREEVPEGTNTEEESSGDMDTEEIDSEAAFRLYVFESEREEPDSLDDTTDKEENAETEDESNSETEDQDEKSETDEEHSEEENAETGGDSEEETEDESNSETEDQDEKLETDEEHSEEENAETGDDSEAEENSNEDGSEKELDEERTVQSGIDGSDEESVDINEKIFTGIISTICSLEGTPVVSVDIGSLGNKLTVAYVLDNDKNLNTIEDHDLYLWDASTDSVGFKTSNDICDENPQFSPDGMALYWYADGQIYYVTGNTAGASVNAVLPEGAVAASSNFCITNDNSVLWAGSSISAMNIIQYNIYKSDNADGGYSSAYKIVTSELNSIGDITAIENGGEAYVAYLLNYLDDDAADIAFEKISSVADLALDNVDIDHTSVQSSAATDFELSLTNNGSTDISTITINVLNTSTNESSSWIENVDLPRGESAIYELSHTFIGDLSEVNDYLFTVTANEESDDRKGDNSQIVKIGYTDISVKSAPYYSDSSYFSNVVIQNNTGMLAADTVLRVRADEKEGAILYEKSFGTLDAYKEYALQLDLFSIAGNADVDELYITLDTSSEDFIEENNTEMEYLHFLWREEEPYPLHLVIQKGESKITEELGNYYVDDIVKVKSNPLRGYDFAGWSTSDGGYFYDSGSEDTYFSMPNCETTLIASYIPNAFLITEQEIAVGESILIAPVYDGIWECKGSEDIAKIRYSGNVAKITGLSDGEITLRYIGKETSEIKEIRVSVYALDSNVIKLAPAA